MNAMVAMGCTRCAQVGRGDAKAFLTAWAAWS
jgi:hypothetical protein